jgi:hypothetical protein
MSNPYAGQQYYEQAWQSGYDYAQANQGADTSQPPDFSSWNLDDATTGYVGQVWEEGALAGQSAGTDVHLARAEGAAGETLSYGHLAHGVVSGWGIIKHLKPFNPVGIVAELFLIALLGASDAPDPDQDLNGWFAQKCQDGGWSEFFVTVDWPDGSDAPSWYGHAHRDFDSAKGEIVDIFNQDSGVYDPAKFSLQVAHYRCDSPGMMEVISVGPPSS